MSSWSKGLFVAAPLRSGGRTRWASRVLSTPVILLAAATAVGGALSASAQPLTGRGIVLAALLTWVIVTLLSAWRWERLGGVSAILAGAAFGVFVLSTAARNEVELAALIGLPLVIVGAGFVVASRGASAESGAGS